MNVKVFKTDFFYLRFSQQKLYRISTTTTTTTTTTTKELNKQINKIVTHSIKPCVSHHSIIIK